MGRPLAGLLVFVALLYALIIWKDWEPKLGLDLRGGTSVILSADSSSGPVSTGTIDKAVDIIRQRVNGTGVSEAEVVRESTNVVVSLPDVGRQDALELVGRTAQLTFRPVVQGPVNGDPNAPVESESPAPTPTGTPTATPTGTASPKPTVSATAQSTLRPSPSATSNGRPVAGALLGQATPAATATPTPSRTPAPTPTATPTGSPAPSGKPSLNQQELAGLFAELNCTDPEEAQRVSKIDDPKNTIVACSRDGQLKYLLGPAEVTGTALKTARAELEQIASGGTTGRWQIAFEMTGDGAKLMKQVTNKYLNQPLAIVLDGYVQSAPTIQGEISNEGQITGDFKEKEAKDLANVLRYGALPISFETSELLTISPTLGEESLRGGLLAGLLGLGLVVLYVLAYYRGLGLVTIAGLAVFGALNYALVVVLGNVEEVNFTLTLAGIAGLIISVGISADSYVVYYERIKDEIKEGRSLRLAIDRAYTSAFRTILAADFVSFLAAAALYLISVGAVRGFAFTLGLATILDVVMSYFFARPTVALLARTRLLRNSGALGQRVPKEA